MNRWLVAGLLLVISCLVRAEVVSNKVPDPTICASHSFKVESGKETAYGKPGYWSWARYSCEEECPGGWEQCASPCPDGGMDFTCLSFVIDDMGGMLRWTEDRGEPGPTILFHPGGGGTSFRPAKEITPPLMENGVKVVQVKWEKGGIITSSSLPVRVPIAGWFTRKESRPSSIKEKSIRPGGMIKWVHDHLAPPEAKYGTAGCSGGALATFAPMYWDTLDGKNPLWDIVDYQYYSGMPGPYDPADVCTPDHENPGVCENDPTITCMKNEECGGPKDRCAFMEIGRWTTSVIPDLMDYVYMSAPDRRCADGRVPEGMKESSMKYSPGFTDVGETIIDFNVSEGWNLYVLGFLGRDDTSIGLTASQGYVYRGLTGGEIHWHDNQPAFHCGSMRDPRFTDDCVDQILRGLNREGN